MTVDILPSDREKKHEKREKWRERESERDRERARQRARERTRARIRMTHDTAHSSLCFHRAIGLRPLLTATVLAGQLSRLIASLCRYKLALGGCCEAFV